MTRLVFAALSATLLSVGLASTAHAETTAAGVVNLAINGYFQEQGIPSHGRLLADFQSRTVTADDIVKAAVEENRLATDASHNKQLVSQVAAYLRSLQSDR